MYKYETHCHSSEGSLCSHITAEELVHLYKKHGFDGIFVTDHFLNGNTSVDRNQPWEKQIEDYCSSFEKAEKIGKEEGLSVFFGWEYSYNYIGKKGKWCGGNDFLTYGLDKEWLLKHPEVMDFELREYCDFIHQNGGFIIHAHPFRNSDYIDMIRLVPESVDGVEIINSSMTNEHINKMADIYANEYGLLKTAGSDMHGREYERISGILTENPIKCPMDMLAELKSGKTKLFVEKNPLPKK